MKVVIAAASPLVPAVVCIMVPLPIIPFMTPSEESSISGDHGR
jgi:hypothetical protein